MIKLNDMLAEKDQATKAGQLKEWRKVQVETLVYRSLADVYTPVGIYLRLRDRFRDTVLLESTDSHAAENSYSYIGVNAIAGIEIGADLVVEYKLPGQKTEKFPLQKGMQPGDLIWDFMNCFQVNSGEHGKVEAAQGLYGYTSYDIVPLIEKLEGASLQNEIPIARYRFYQYVIAINHYSDELLILENKVEGVSSEIGQLRSWIQGKDVPVYPFHPQGEEDSNMTDEAYMEIVKKGIAHCHRGDVFQVVLSRRYQQAYTGDDFNVYRALRHVNPSPYLFYFDYGDYRLMGSSPESQLRVHKEEVTLNPIAGTYRRSGDDETDQLKAEELLQDPKENAEHVMLVDLARNDLSKVSKDVTLTSFRQIQYYSHVIHMVSQVKGQLPPGSNPFLALYQTFPAGTLSGAPKFSAMQIIRKLEKTNRSFYGGAIGFAGFNGHCNHAIIIRSFLSRQNTLIYQAGAGVVAGSRPEDELAEIKNKLGALKKAIGLASKLEI